MRVLKIAALGGSLLAAACASHTDSGPAGLSPAASVAGSADVVTAAEIRSYVEGNTINSDGAALSYGADGRYTYNGRSPGRYTISDGEICVAFDIGQRRCDSIVRNGEGYTLVNAQGYRFSFSRS